MRIAMLTILVVLFVAGGFAQQTAVEKARIAVDLLLQEKYADVVAMFGAQMKASLTAEKLSSGLHPALQQIGAVTRKLDPQVQVAGDNQVITLPVEFERATMNLVVSFNPAGEINGLWMRPAAVPPAPTAPQAAPSDAAAAKATQAVDLILQQKYADVIAMLAPQIRTALSEDKLRSGLQPILQAAGGVRKRLEPRTQTSGDQQVVILPIQFERATWEFVITVNKTGELGGLLARPGNDTSVLWVPPAYSKPDSFRTEEVMIGKAEWRLPGTLALPAAKGPVAGLVLVHGSGPNDRDESIGPQKPFRDLAEGLASRGAAVLRYEKRTRYAAAKLATIKNFTVQDETGDDALAAAEFLRSRPEIDPNRVFVLGHSLGGYLITRIGRQDPKLAGLISLAGAARPLEDLMVEQNQYLATLQGNPPGAQEHIDKLKAEAQRAKTLKADTLNAPGEVLLGAPPSYWIDLQGYDPAMEARELKQPMLFLQAERDYQVTMTDFARWQDGLSERKNVKFRSFPTLNHLFQAGEGKSMPNEYMAKPDHVVPEVIEEIATWLGKIGG